MFCIKDPIIRQRMRLCLLNLSSFRIFCDCWIACYTSVPLLFTSSVTFLLLTDFWRSYWCYAGVFYLYMKTIERAHTPNKLWERVKLPRNYEKALEVIDKHLVWCSEFLDKTNETCNHQTRGGLDNLFHFICRNIGLSYLCTKSSNALLKWLNTGYVWGSFN